MEPFLKSDLPSLTFTTVGFPDLADSFACINTSFRISYAFLFVDIIFSFVCVYVCRSILHYHYNKLLVTSQETFIEFYSFNYIGFYIKY